MTVVGRLGRRLVARHRAAAGTGGALLASRIHAARSSQRILAAATRLASGRAPKTLQPQGAPAVTPPGMSDFAARWIFGDGPPEGIPIAGEPDLESLPAAEGKPTFLEREAAPAQSPEQVRRAMLPMLRGSVEELPSSFRLSSHREDVADTPSPLPEPPKRTGSIEEPEPIPTPPGNGAQELPVAGPASEAADQPPTAEEPQPAPTTSGTTTTASAASPSQPVAADPLPPHTATEHAAAANPKAGAAVPLRPPVVARPVPRASAEATPALATRAPDPAKPARPIVVLRAAAAVSRPEAAANPPPESSGDPVPASAPLAIRIARTLLLPLRAARRQAAPSALIAPTKQPPAPVSQAQPGSAAPPPSDHKATNAARPSEPLRPLPPAVAQSLDSPAPADTTSTVARASDDDPEFASQRVIPQSDAEHQPAPAADKVGARAAIEVIARSAVSRPGAADPTDDRDPEPALAYEPAAAAEPPAPPPAPEHEGSQPTHAPLSSPIETGEPEPIRLVLTPSRPAPPVTTFSPRARTAPPDNPMSPSRVPARASVPRSLAPSQPEPLRLVSRVARPRRDTRLDAAPAPAAPTSVVGAAPTRGERLARATGSTLVHDEAGRETVIFPTASTLARSESPTLQRADAAPDQPAPASGATASGTASHRSPSTPHSAGSSSDSNIDEVYEQVLARLRRDLVADRERMGDLIGDLP